jgi:ABC-type uncharacterized transport system involved in gliding motility auxiliary subunit
MRKENRSMKLKSTSNMSAAVLLVLVLAVVVSLLANRHYMRWDLTASGEHTLSAKTLQVLKTIKEPVMIKAFVREGYPEADEAKVLLSAYAYGSPSVSFEIIDPDRNPVLTRKYQVRAINTFILEGYGRTQTVKLADEEAITNGLVRLSREGIKICYWVTGHGERAYKGAEEGFLTVLQETLSKENLRFADLNLMQADIPKDAAMVVVAAPEKPLFPEEVTSLRTYLNRGGSLLIFLEPFTDGGLKDFLSDYGIRLSDDIIVDKMSRVMGGDFLLPMATRYGTHEISKDFKLTSFFQVARSVEKVDPPPPGVRLKGLAFTSKNSWAEMDQESLNRGEVGFDQKTDRQGPLCLAVVAELHPSARKGEEGKKGEKPEKTGEALTGEGKMVVFGDIDFSSNKFFGVAGNGDFIINTVNFLGGRKDLITIKKKHRAVEALMLTRGQAQFVFWIPVVIIPALVLITGIFVWFRRRSK